MNSKIFILALSCLNSVVFSNDTTKTIVWVVDNIKSIGGHPVTLEGAPKVVEKDGHKAVEFNGKNDGLFLDANPMIGASEFTVEVVFMPYSDGQNAQRFLHFQQGDNNRLLVELRLSGGKWFLDSFIASGSSRRVLYSEGILHDADKWAHSELVYKDNTMTHYVDGKKELEGALNYTPVTSGTASIGVRQNKVSWFRGAIRLVKVTHRALSPDEFLINKKEATPDPTSVRDGSGRNEMSIDNIIHSPNLKSGILAFSVKKTGSYIINLIKPDGKVINRIRTRNLVPGQHTIPFNLNTIAPGIYIFSLKGDNTCLSKKWAIMY